MSARTKFKPWGKRPFSAKSNEDPAMHRKVVESMTDDGLFAARMDLMGRELSSSNQADRWAIARLAAIQKEANKRSLVPA